MTQTSGRIFYVLLGYGEKPTPPYANHPAARRQVDNLRIAFPESMARKDRFLWDYARRINHLDDLPKLKSMLQEILTQGAGALIVDNFARLFGRCPMAGRLVLLKELEPYGERLFEVRSKTRLSQMNTDQRHFLLFQPETLLRWEMDGARTRRPSDARQNATKLASAASLAARREAAADRNLKIAELKGEMSADGRPDKAADVAEEANRRLLRTAHGKVWTERSVGEALRQFKLQNSNE